jgi:hypothetical protein
MNHTAKSGRITPSDSETRPITDNQVWRYQHSLRAMIDAVRTLQPLLSATLDAADDNDPGRLIPKLSGINTAVDDLVRYRDDIIKRATKDGCWQP